MGTLTEGLASVKRLVEWATQRKCIVGILLLEMLAKIVQTVARRITCIDDPPK
jgi:hypothetical protein